MKNNISIVIISDARLNSQVTKDCVESLKGQDIHEIIVVESEPNTVYVGTNTVNPPKGWEFNYNKFLNYGASFASGFYVAFCNNDLLFHENWWERLYQSMTKHNIKSASPICPNSHKEYGYTVSDKVIIGQNIRQHIAGWCIVLDRLWFLRMGGFDERFTFWCADNSYGEQLKSFDEKHLLDCGSIVHHVQSASLDKLDDKKRDDYTRKQVMKFNRQFNANIFNL